MTTPIPLLLGQTQPMYLGRPGAMNRLRMPDSPYQSTASRGESVQTLASGGVVVTRNNRIKRTWMLPFSGMTMDTANLLTAYYAGAMGLGPFCFVDPAWRNVLGSHVSSMGQAISSISGWATAVTSTSLAWDGTGLAAPFPESGVMNWLSPTTSSKFGLGSWTGGVLRPNVNEAPVYLLDQPLACSIYARTISSTASVSLSVAGVDAAGAVQVAGTTSTVTANSTTWTRLTSLLAAGNATALYAIPTITCNTASAPTLRFACADLQYGVTAATLQAWVLGFGSPRVNVMPDSGGFTSVSRLLPYRDHALMLGEV